MPAKYRFVLNLYDEEKTSSLPPSRRGTASAPPSLRKDLEARKAAAKYYYPTDIFQSLPRHHDLPDFAGSIVPNTENRGDAKSSSSGRKAGKKKKKTVLTESAAGLGEDPASSNTPPEQVLDLRFGPISIDWVDFLPAPSSETTEMVASSHMTSIDYADALRGRTTINAPNGGGGGDATPPRTASSPFSAPETPTPVARFSQLSVSSTAGDGAPADGAPTFLAGSADIAYGIVHLFGDKEEAERSGTTSSAGKGVEAFPALGSASASTSGPGAADSIDAASASTSQDVASTDAQALPKEDDTSGTVLGVLAVPAYMTAADFLAFVEPAADAISHLRMIR